MFFYDAYFRVMFPQKANEMHKLIQHKVWQEEVIMQQEKIIRELRNKIKKYEGNE